VGRVRDVRLIKDRAGKSKGMGYVEFAALEAVPAALLLNGQKFCMKHAACTCSGFPCEVRASQAEKNYVAAAEAAGGSSFSAGAERRVYVGNLHPNVTESDLKQVAGLVAPVERVAILRDARGASRGHAFVTFTVNACAAGLAGGPWAGALREWAGCPLRAACSAHDAAPVG
jgi:RNA-binding protein 39